jgi:hypothetical protein
MRNLDFVVGKDDKSRLCRRFLTCKNRGTLQIRYPSWSTVGPMEYYNIP